jgi:dephospho-CoA kinase
MRVVALTGGIGSGKSEACRAFEALKVPVVDVDVISHQLTAAGSSLMMEIAAQFGDGFVTAAGAMDRTRMRELVFSDASARAQLNAILHPHIFRKAVEQISAYSNLLYVILAIPLLLESERYHAMIDHVLLIDCDEALQVQRVMQRSDLTETEVSKILAVQSSRAARLSFADTVITNNGSLDELHQKINEFHENYINTCIVSK